MAISLEETKDFLRITYDNDDNYINELISMAEKYIEEQTGVEYKEDDKVYKIAILQVVAHFYDKRESVSEKNAVIVPYTMDSLIKHIGIRGPLKNE